MRFSLSACSWSLALLLCCLVASVLSVPTTAGQAQNKDVQEKDVVHIVFSNHLVRTVPAELTGNMHTHR